MDKNCSNHPFINAHWLCKKCNKTYCFDCVEKKAFKFSKNDTYAHICTDCKKPLDWIGINHIFNSPFKSILSAIRYTLSLKALMVILTITIVSMFFGDNFVINELLFLLNWCIITSYATTATETFIKGDIKAPFFTAVPRQLVLQHIFRIFKQAFVYFIVCTLFVVVKNMLSPKAAYYMIPLFAFLLPFIVLKIITANTTKVLFNLTPFPVVIKNSLILYLATCAALCPAIMIFDLMFNAKPVIVTLVLGFTIVIAYRLLGQIALENSTELNVTVDYEKFKGMYTLESRHGFRT